MSSLCSLEFSKIVIAARTKLFTTSWRRAARLCPAPQQHAVPCKRLISSQFSSVASESPCREKANDERHCPSCTCDHDSGTPSNELEGPQCLPPEPKYSVHRRVLPTNLTALSSPAGRTLLLESLRQPQNSNYSSSYWSLSEHFCSQSNPAYCGVTTLFMVLNALGVDLPVSADGDWRYYGNDEEVLLDRGCFNKGRVQRIGISFDEFYKLAKCNGVDIRQVRATSEISLEQFRQEVKNVLSTETRMLVSNYSRARLGQTGEGHFSPLAAYHPAADQVLLMDVAKFKYPPYWVRLAELYEAMIEQDTMSNKPRGWFVVQAPPHRLDS